MGPSARRHSAPKLVVSFCILLFLAAVVASPSQAQWNVSAEFLYWEPVGTGADAGIVKKGLTDTFPTRATGPIEGIDHGFAPGVRLTAGWDPVRVSWTYFRATETFSEACPPTVNCLLQAPRLALLAVNSASAKSVISLQMVDLDLRPQLVATDRLTSHWFIGFRFAELKSSLRVHYATAGVVLPGVETFDADAKNDMFGLRTGIDGRYKLFQQFDVEGMFALSALRGQSEARLTDTFVQFTFPPEASNGTRLERDTVVPVVELGLRAIWTPVKNLDVWVGYEFLQFFNVFRATIIASRRANLEGELDRNVGFHGLQAGVRWRF